MTVRNELATSCQRCGNARQRREGRTTRNGPLCAACVGQMTALEPRDRNPEWDDVTDRARPQSHRFAIRIQSELVEQAVRALKDAGITFVPERDLLCARENGHEAFTGEDVELVAQGLRQFSLDDGLQPVLPPWNKAWDFTMRWQLLDLATRAGNWDGYALDMPAPEIGEDPEAWTRMCADYPNLFGREAAPGAAGPKSAAQKGGQRV